MTSTPYSPFVFRVIGEQIIGRAVHGNSRSYVAFFGVHPLKVYQLWQLIVDNDSDRSNKKFEPNHLMWALLLLRSYSREEMLATLVGVTEKTFRKWAWMMVEEISKIESLIVWENRFLGSPNMRNKCFVSVDGTDLAIQEPTRPVDPHWFSHKLKRAAVRYELAIGIGSGYIVWVNGPFPAGTYSDLTIARLGLVEFLNNDESYIADGGYIDGNQYAITPTGRHSYRDRQMSVVRSRHETINSRLKQWTILAVMFRHPLQKHSSAFRAVANIVQLGLQTDSPAFQVHYDEREFE